MDSDPVRSQLEGTRCRGREPGLRLPVARQSRNGPSGRRAGSPGRLPVANEKYHIKKLVRVTLSVESLRSRPRKHHAQSSHSRTANGLRRGPKFHLLFLMNTAMMKGVPPLPLFREGRENGENVQLVLQKCNSNDINRLSSCLYLTFNISFLHNSLAPFLRLGLFERVSQPLSFQDGATETDATNGTQGQGKK